MVEILRKGLSEKRALNMYNSINPILVCIRSLYYGNGVSFHSFTNMYFKKYIYFNPFLIK